MPSPLRDGGELLQELIRGATTNDEVRTRWASDLHGEDPEAWLSLDRTALLRRLASRGIPLTGRQQLANVVGRKRRALQRTTHLPVYDSASEPSVATPAGGNAALAEIRRRVLSGEAQFDSSSGHVRIAPGDSELLRIWASDFGECGDSGCRCYRIAYPQVRHDFRNVVVRRTTAAARAAAIVEGATAAVRYVSVGCGSLLTDFEILCGLASQGVGIESIILADVVYTTPPTPEQHACFNLLAGVGLDRLKPLLKPSRGADLLCDGPSALAACGGGMPAPTGRLSRLTDCAHCLRRPLPSGPRLRLQLDRAAAQRGHGSPQRVLRRASLRPLRRRAHSSRAEPGARRAGARRWWARLPAP